MPQMQILLNKHMDDTQESKKIRQFLNSLSEGIYIADCLRKIYFWNTSAERITGYTAAEVTGKYCNDNILDHFDESGINICKSTCPILSAIKTGNPVEKRVFLRRKMGNRIPVYVYTLPIRDEENKTIGAIELFSDTHSYEEFNNTLKPILYKLL